jgi:hypothetical protein
MAATIQCDCADYPNVHPATSRCLRGDGVRPAFVKLTGVDGLPFYVKAEHVSVVEPRTKGGSWVYVLGDAENPDQASEPSAEVVAAVERVLAGGS